MLRAQKNAVGALAHHGKSVRGHLCRRNRPRCAAPTLILDARNLSPPTSPGIEFSGQGFGIIDPSHRVHSVNLVYEIDRSVGLGKLSWSYQNRIKCVVITRLPSSTGLGSLGEVAHLPIISYPKIPSNFAPSNRETALNWLRLLGFALAGIDFVRKAPPRVWTRPCICLKEERRIFLNYIDFIYRFGRN